MNGREVDDLVNETRKRLDMYKTANIGNLLTETISSVDETTKTIQETMARLERIKQQLELKQQRQQEQIAELGEIEHEFKVQRDQKYQTDAAKLQTLIDAPLRTELLHTREEISKLNKSLAQQHQMGLAEMITTQQKEDTIMLGVFESFGLKLEKLKGLSKREVWGLIQDIWGEPSS